MLLKEDKPASESDERLLFDQLNKVLQEVGAPTAPFSVFCKSPRYPAFKKGCPHFLSFLMTYFKPKHRAEKLWVMYILLKMIVRHLKTQDYVKAINAGSVGEWLDKVQDVTDNQFPGYRQSGLLPHVLARIRPTG